MLRILQAVSKLQVEILKINAVNDEIHSWEIVISRIDLLAVSFRNLQAFKNID